MVLHIKNSYYQILLWSLTTINISHCSEEARFVGSSTTTQTEQQTKDRAASQDINLKFDSTEITDSNLSVNLNKEFSDLNIILKRSEQTAATSFEQLSRPVITEQITQGSKGKLQEETLTQNNLAKLDLLIVIDNSNSMQKEQINLAMRMDSLLKDISASDWQIAVTTTSASNANCLTGLMRKGDDDVKVAFKTAIETGTGGNQTERGILMARRALDGTCTSGSKWVRDNSSIGILIVSDEDNCSNGNAQSCKNQPDRNYKFLTDYIESTGRKLKTDARIYGIFFHPDDNVCKPDDDIENVATEYNKAVEATGGTWGPICDEDYSLTLEKISKDVQTILKDQYMLTFLPSSDDVKIFVNNEDWTGKFTIDNQIVKFTTVPPPGSEIKISYYHDGSPIKQRFKLSDRPFNQQVSVKINDIPSSDTDYQYDSNQNEITFDETPPENATIEIKFIKELELQQQFSLNLQNIIDSSLVVLVNGQATSEFRYDDIDKMLIFSNPPPESANITVQYKTLGSAILKYPFTFTDGEPDGYFAFDQSPEKRIDVRIDKDSIEFLEKDFVDGRIVTVRVFKTLSDGLTIELPAKPVPGSVTVEGKNVACQADQIVIKDNIISANCLFGNSEAANVHFKYVLKHHNEFDLNLPKGVNANDIKWQVLVNHEPHNDWLINADKLTFTQPLPIYSTVEVNGKY